MKRTLRPPLVKNVCLCLCLVAGMGCQYPKDMEGSLNKIRGGTLDVGVTENPPWVTRNGNRAAGVEPELIQGLAENLDAEVRWHWGQESQLIKSLGQFRLHMVIGGLTKASHLSKRAALTKPYYTNASTSEKHVLALAKGENAWLMEVQRYLNQSPHVERALIGMERIRSR